MCVIAEKKMQLNSASLYVVVIFIIGGILIGGPGPPPWLRLCSNGIQWVIGYSRPTGNIEYCARWRDVVMKVGASKILFRN